MVWASRWSVALRAFYRQILSLTYSFLSLKLPPPACPGTTGIGFFFLWIVLLFIPQIGVVSSSVGLYFRDKLEACFEKTGGYRKYIMRCASRYLRSLLDADGRFPRRQEAETTTFTDATGASRSALVSHEEVQAWADECHDCQLVEF